MKWYRLYKEETEEGAFKVGDRVRVADTYKGKPTTGGRFSDDPPSPGMTGTVVDINRQRYHDFKSSSMGLGMSREKTRMWYVVRIDDSCRKGCFVPGEYGFDEKDLVKIDAVNESYEDVNLKKILKQNGVTKLPSGTEFKPDRISWSKDGGYAGRKTLDKVCSQLEDAGWKKGEWRTGGVPDGSAVSNSNAYTSPDGQLVMTYSEHYGATAQDNFYGFTFKLTGNQVNESVTSDFIVATLVKIDRTGEKEIESKQVSDYWDAMELLEDYAIAHSDDDEWVAEKYAKFMSGEDKPGKNRHVGWLAKKGRIDEEFIKGGYTIELRVKESNELDYSEYEQYEESSRFGFNIGDKVELTKDKSNSFSGDVVKAGTQGEVVAVDKPMKGVIKVKIEGGKVISVPERGIKMAGTDNEPWEKFKKPPKPPRKPDPETLARQRPERIYMEPPRPGYPKWTGD